MSMKRFILLFTALAVFTFCKAQQRSDAEMDSIALVVLERNVQFAKAKGSEKGLITFNKERLENLTILSNSAGAVIVSNSQNAIPVLGYSFDYRAEKEFPCGYKWWIEAVNQSLSQNKSRKATISPPPGFPSRVEPIVKSQWTQYSPYNNLCPSGRLAGCVAIALAQILYAYKYPVHGIGSKSYTWNEQTLSADFETTYYDWDDMLDSYSNKNYTEQQAHAVAELVSHCGIAVSMNYGYSVSTAYQILLRSALRSYFDYETDSYKDRSMYSDSEWMNIIFTDISQGHPIAYSGEDVAGQTGHSFVLDGYDQNGLIHVNWGWGFDDGYFDLSQIYSYNQQMIHGIVPKNNTIDNNIYLTIQHALNGSLSLVVNEKKAYDYMFEPAEGWRIHSVTFNGNDVTTELNAENEYRTPMITASSSLYVTYEKIGSGIVSLPESRMRVLAYGNNITIKDVTAGERIVVYSVDGKEVATAIADGLGIVTIVLPDNQTYIVKGQMKTVKVRL